MLHDSTLLHMWSVLIWSDRPPRSLERLGAVSGSSRLQEWAWTGRCVEREGAVSAKLHHWVTISAKRPPTRLRAQFSKRGERAVRAVVTWPQSRNAKWNCIPQLLLINSYLWTSTYRQRYIVSLSTDKCTETEDFCICFSYLINLKYIAFLKCFFLLCLYFLSIF